MSDKLYQKYLSTHYSHFHQGSNFENDLPYINANFLQFLPQSKEAKILDIGCGTGIFLNFLKSSGYRNYVGVDISEEQINFCRDHVTKQVYLIKDIKTYLKSQKITFDFILMNDVIEHLEKNTIIDTITLIYEALKNDGIVLIKTANLKNRWGMAVRYMDFTHTVGFTQESLQQVMLVSGFNKVEIRKEIHPIHNIKSFFRILLKSFFELLYLLENIASFGTFDVILSNMIIAVGTKTNYDGK